MEEKIMGNKKDDELYLNALNDKNLLTHSKDNNTIKKNVVPPVKPKENNNND